MYPSEPRCKKWGDMTPAPMGVPPLCLKTTFVQICEKGSTPKIWESKNSAKFNAIYTMTANKSEKGKNKWSTTTPHWAKIVNWRP